MYETVKPPKKHFCLEDVPRMSGKLASNATPIWLQKQNFQGNLHSTTLASDRATYAPNQLPTWKTTNFYWLFQWDDSKSLHEKRLEIINTHLKLVV